MRCKLVLCEGEYDCCFIEELLSGKEYYTTKRDEMKKVYDFIRRFRKKENVLIIHESGGKQYLYKKMKDLLSKLRGSPFKMILMIDQNYNDVFGKVTHKIEEFVNTPSRFTKAQKPALMDEGNATLALSFKKHLSNIFVAEVSGSLEREVAKKLREKFELPTSDPHDLISLVVERQLLNGVENECDVFKLAASEGWFRGESWFHRLSDLLNE